MVEKKDSFIDALTHAKVVSKCLILSPIEDYPPIYMNCSKKPEVSEVVND